MDTLFALDLQFALVVAAFVVAAAVTLRAFLRQFTHGDADDEHAAGGCAHCPSNPHTAVRPSAEADTPPLFDLSGEILRR